MFNLLLSIYPLFLLSLGSFLSIFTVRQYIKRPLFILLYHMFLFVILSIAALGGGGVQNDGYQRLKQFISLEENNQLEDAKKNPEKYDRMLQIDLQEFKNSDEFRNYLKEHDIAVDRAEAITIGWLFVLVAEISVALVKLLEVIVVVLRKKYYK